MAISGLRGDEIVRILPVNSIWYIDDSLAKTIRNCGQVNHIVTHFEFGGVGRIIDLYRITGPIDIVKLSLCSNLIRPRYSRFSCPNIFCIDIGRFCNPDSEGIFMSRLRASRGRQFLRSNTVFIHYRNAIMRGAKPTCRQ